MSKIAPKVVNLKESMEGSRSLQILEALVKASLLDPEKQVRDAAIEALRSTPLLSGVELHGGVASEDRLYLKLKPENKQTALVYFCDVPEEYIGNSPPEIHPF